MSAGRGFCLKMCCCCGCCFSPSSLAAAQEQLEAAQPQLSFPWVGSCTCTVAGVQGIGKRSSNVDTASSCLASAELLAAQPSTGRGKGKAFWLHSQIHWAGMLDPTHGPYVGTERLKFCHWLCPGFLWDLKKITLLQSPVYLSLPRAHIET